ncbi:MAG: VOC family protein [Burkholderiaceae bacterium]
MKLALDHVVIAARKLDEGVAWCEATLGVTPGAGGQHHFMGTHNRLLCIASAQFPRSYLEVIAIDPQGAKPARPRWFDLDSTTARAALETGPKLWHWVARTNDIDAACKSMRAFGADCGEVVQAQRATAHGMLRWRITIRPDGQRLCGGALPTLIEWTGAHPVDTMAPSGAQLRGVSLNGLPDGVKRCLPAGVDTAGTAPMKIELSTPLGQVGLRADPAGA